MKKLHNRERYSCTINGVYYESERMAAKALGIGIRKLRNCLQSPNYPEYISNHRSKEYHREARSYRKYPCIIDGIHYESETAAAISLNIGLSAVRNRLRSSSYPRYVSDYHHKEDRSNKKYTSCAIAGVEYKSILSASRDLRISYNEMKRRLVSVDYPDYVCDKIPKKLAAPTKNRGYPCTINGVRYESENAAARALSVGLGALRSRLQSPNYPEYISKHRLKKNPGEAHGVERYSCTINGIHYESERMAVRILGIGIRKLRNYLQSPDYPEYISKHRKEKYRDKKRSGIPCSVDGVEYKSLISAMAYLGISYNEMKRRLVSADYPDYVCDKIPRKLVAPTKNGGHPCIINGVYYESETAAYRALGIRITVLRGRFRSSNFPNYISKYHKKIKRRKKITPRNCTIKGVEYVSVADAAKKLKIDVSTISNRLRSFKYPDYVCADIPKRSPKPPKYSYVVSGKKYRTLQEAADAEGVTRERIRQKMRNPKKPEYQRFKRGYDY